MTITNGYCTLAEFRQELFSQSTYTASTISFTSSGSMMLDSAYGFNRFQVGNTAYPTLLTISGSGSNNGTFQVAAAGSAGQIQLSGTMTTEGAGLTVTITDVSNTADDATIELIIEAASRKIEDATGRKFYTSGSSARYYTALTDEWCIIDDATAVTAVETDDENDRTYSTTWTTSDYELEPLNASADGKPYTDIEVKPYGSYTFPTNRNGVKVSGTFGYSATAPKQIKRACLLQAVRWFKRKDSPFGMISNEMGQIRTIPGLDPDVEMILKPFVRNI